MYRGERNMKPEEILAHEIAHIKYTSENGLDDYKRGYIAGIERAIKEFFKPSKSQQKPAHDPYAEQGIDSKSYIPILEGHDGSSYFWFYPIRVIDENKSTTDLDNLEEFFECEISIEEMNIYDYLHNYFKMFFDNNLKYNIARGEEYNSKRYKDGIAFEWYLTENYYTLDSIERMIEAIRNDYMLTEKGSARELGRIEEFYFRFCEYMDKMVRAARENGYPLICIMGP